MLGWSGARSESGNFAGGLSLVGTLSYRLPSGTEELIYQLPPQIYLTGDKPPNSHSKLSCRNCWCSFFDSSLNECVLLHLVTEYTFNFPGARSERGDFRWQSGKHGREGTLKCFRHRLKKRDCPLWTESDRIPQNLTVRFFGVVKGDKNRDQCYVESIAVIQLFLEVTIDKLTFLIGNMPDRLSCCLGNSE